MRALERYGWILPPSYLCILCKLTHSVVYLRGVVDTGEDSEPRHPAPIELIHLRVFKYVERKCGVKIHCVHIIYTMYIIHCMHYCTCQHKVRRTYSSRTKFSFRWASFSFSLIRLLGGGRKSMESWNVSITLPFRWAQVKKNSTSNSIFLS